MASILDHYKEISFCGLKIGKIIFYGIPRSGKTTLRKQLMRSIDSRLEDCNAHEPSTNIGEICDPILIEHVLAKNEEGNEWTWTVQKLDELAKTLLQSIDITLSRNEGKQETMVIEETSTPKAQHTEKAKSMNVTNNPGSHEPSTQPIAEGEKFQMTSSAVADKSTITDNSTFTAAVSANQIEKQTPEIDLKKCFLDAVKTGKWEDVRKALHLDNAMLLQVIDCGGQPTFQEIFPFLISGPSVTLLMFNLSEDLTQPQNVRYLQNQHEEEKTWQNETYIPKDFILKAISSQIKLDSKLLLIGTHKDLFGDSEEKRQEGFKTVAATLHNLLKTSKDFKDIQHFQDFIVGVGFQPNDTQPTETQANKIDQEDLRQVKTKIEKLIVMFQPTDTQGIPAPWLIFDLILHKYAKSKKLGKLDKVTCRYISEECGIKEEIDYVLFFLHHKAGTVLYYPQIPELKNFVFTDFQPIIDFISSIIINYFNGISEREGHDAWNGLLKTASVRKIDGYLEADELVSLLKHRHIISQINDETFFMPSLLPKAEPSYSNTPNDMCSILVMVKNEYCPIGVFCAVSTRLASITNWKINESVPQFKNRMYFYYALPDASYGIILSALNDYYEVNETLIDIPSKVKLNVYKDINDAFKEVCEDLQLAIPSYAIYTNPGGDYERLCYNDMHTEQRKPWSLQVGVSECILINN